MTEEKQGPEPKVELELALAKLHALEPLLMRWAELEPVVPFGATTMWQGIKSGDFPAPVRLTARAVGWWNHEIRDALNSRPRWTGASGGSGRKRGRPRKPIVSPSPIGEGRSHG